MALDWERRGLLPKGLSLEQVELTGDRVLVHAFARSTAAACPQCGRLSRQVPDCGDAYLRRLHAAGRRGEHCGALHIPYPVADASGLKRRTAARTAHGTHHGEPVDCAALRRSRLLRRLDARRRVDRYP